MRGRVLTFLLAIALLGTACGGADDTAAATDTTAAGETADTTTTAAEATDSTDDATGSGTMDELSVIILPYITFAPYYIAIEEGYFAEQGIEVEPVNMTITEEVMPALSSGQVDVASGLVSAGMLNAIARGADVQITADKGFVDPDGCVNFSVIGQSDLVAAGELETADQLEGRTVSVVPASWLEYYFSRVLETGGLTMDDVDAVNVGSPSMVDGLASGQLDAVVNSEPWLKIFTNNGHAQVLATPQELTPGESAAVQVYGPNLLDENRDLGVRFMAAYLKAVDQYSEGPTERNLDIVEGFTELDRGLLENICWPGINPTGEVVVEGVVDFQEFALDRGYIDEVVPPEEFYDGSFIEEARALMDGTG